MLDEILTKHPELEFVQLQINYLDWESQWVQSKACYEVAVKHDKPVIVMEPVKGGTLAKVPAEVEKLFREYAPESSPASWAVRFAASLENVFMVLSGMSSLTQMEDNLSYMERFQPLKGEELALVQKAEKLINGQIAIPCTGCSYCTDGCPTKSPFSIFAFPAAATKISACLHAPFKSFVRVWHTVTVASPG